MSTGAHAVPGRRARITPRAALLAVVMVALLAAGVVPLQQYMDQRAEIRSLEEQVDALLQQRARLEHRVDRLRDPEYLELLARKCLGMVKKGEISFVAVPEGGEPHPASC